MIFNLEETVIYTKRNKKAKIIKIHYDDIVPYYTILLGNREIQTISKYLKTIEKKTRKNKIRRNNTLKKYRFN